MKQILVIVLTIHCLPQLQTLDINALRMAQKRMAKANTSNANYSSNSGKKDLFILDKSLIPEDYRVGPGDKIHINVISSNETFDYNLIISPSGELLIPSVGIIKTNKLTLDQLIKLIRDKIKTWNLDAQVNVELEGIREFKVLVTGHFKNAGYFSSTAISRISDLFADVTQKYEEQIQEELNNKSEKNSKGNSNYQNSFSIEELYNNRIPENKDLTDFKKLSKRNIKVIRANDTINIDLQRFQSTGDISQNPYINQGDIINIPFIEYKNYIYGGIKNAGSYEYKYGDTLEDLIELSGGLKKDIKEIKVEIIHSNKFDSKSTYLSLGEKNSFKLSPEDQVMIPYLDYKKSRKMVKISGEINYPGIYPLTTSFDKLIQSAGGFTEYADTSKIRIYNTEIGEETDLELERILLINDLNRTTDENAYAKARIRSQKGYLETKLNILKNSKELILANDEIHIPTYYPYIEVIGAINKPGRYPYVKDKSISYYINQSGGLIKGRSSKRFLIKSSTGQKKKFKKNQIIENTDIIFISEKPDYEKWIITREAITAFSQIITTIVVIQRILENN